jgi:hypothetical protein
MSAGISMQSAGPFFFYTDPMAGWLAIEMPQWNNDTIRRQPPLYVMGLKLSLYNSGVCINIY